MYFDYWFYFFESTFSFGYYCVMPLLIIVYLFCRKYREKIIKIIAIANGWFAVGEFLFFFYWASTFFFAWYSQNQYEGYTFYDHTGLFSSYGFLFWFQFITIPLSILFFWKRLRRSIWLSSIILFIKLITNEKIIIYFTSSYKDYLPSSWEQTQPEDWWENDFFKLFIYLLVIAATYLIQLTWRKRKLLSPANPSA